MMVAWLREFLQANYAMFDVSLRQCHYRHKEGEHRQALLARDGGVAS